MSSKNDDLQNPNRKIALIASCSGWGSGRAAAERGPIELLNAGLAESLNAMVVIVQAEPSMEGCSLPMEQVEKAIASHALKISDAVVVAIEGGYLPVVIGGDHISAIGFHSGLARAHGETGIVWMDTHPDLNTPETSPSGNIHGMVLASLLGRGSETMLRAANACQTKEKHVAMIGTRDIDAGEQKWIDEGVITCMTMGYVNEHGLEESVHKAVEIANIAEAGFGLTIDLDVIDPSDAPFVATPVEGGMKATALIQALQSTPSKDRLLGMEVTEFTPRNEGDAALGAAIVSSLVTAITTL
ncbi:MAG TPA: hypothetical protein EYO40_01445 [Phycisphaerales bacterium]|nr:hypothetical protein [Flavobacteriales bacterium]HIB49945.1 hypothetical protein [Phycisphaerales bacterium]